MKKIGVFLVLVPMIFCHALSAQQLDTTHHQLLSTPVLIDTQATGTVWRTKGSTTANQLKIESVIRELIQQDSEPNHWAPPKGLHTWAQIDNDRHVLVYLEAAPTRVSNLVATLKAAPLHILPVSYSSQCSLITAWVDIQQMGNVARLSDLKSIRLVTVPMQNAQPVISKGDTIMHTMLARKKYPNAWGEGVTVGILSDDCGSREGLVAPRQQSDELPPNVNTDLDTYDGLATPRTHEGLALMEIIHDIAPKSSLVFAEGVSNVTNLCTNIRKLAAMGCNVIMDDVTFLEEPDFEDGDVASAIHDVESSGVVYITSAGNFGRDVLSIPFLGMNVNLSDGQTHFVQDFGGHHPYNQVWIPNGQTLDVRLQWNDRSFSSPNHLYDLILIDDQTQQILFTASSRDKALQTIRWTNTTGSGKTCDVLIEGASPMAGQQLLLINHSSNRLLPPQYVNGIASVLGHAMSADALTCAAVSAFGDNPEGYSSMGPVNLSNGSTRSKPDIAAPDQVATSVPGFCCFGGTSAAAAHVAGLAAMIRSRHPSWTASQVKKAIVRGALSISPFPSSAMGSGMADATNSIP